MSYQNGPKIVTDGLILALDAGNPKSYPGSGNAWYDLSGRGAHGTLAGNVSFTSSYMNFPTAGDANYVSSTLSQNYLDCTVVLNPDFSRTQPSSIAGLIATNVNSSGADKSLRFVGVNGTGPWNVTSRNPGDANDWAYSAGTTYYVNGAVSNVLVSGWNIFGGYRTNQNTFPASFAYHLGSSAYLDRGFQGKIAAVFMYNRQLSKDEQIQNYNALRGRYGL